MYRTLNNRFSSRPVNRTGHRFSGNRKSSQINPSLYINKISDPVAAETVESSATFSDFHFDEAIVKQIARKGYRQPTQIQEQAIPLIMSGRDVIGIANTGTGKTAAFLLPLIHKVLQNRSTQALIIVPTRELAVQIYEELRSFTYGLPIFSALCIGSYSFNDQARALKRYPHFIIGTPGRLKDHQSRHTLQLATITDLVLDEADLLVDMGFINDVRTLIAGLPAKRQSLFFSATILPAISSLIDSFMNNPQTVSVKTRDTSTNVYQDVIRYTDNSHRLSLLLELLNKEELQKVLIFGRTKHGVEKLHQTLSDSGFSSVSIHGNKNQPQRQRALREFKENRAKIMVATDVAARGLDIPLVTHVINYEVPENYTDYIHRIGRTGRANKKGVALTFIQ